MASLPGYPERAEEGFRVGLDWTTGVMALVVFVHRSRLNPYRLLVFPYTTADVQPLRSHGMRRCSTCLPRSFPARPTARIARSATWLDFMKASRTPKLLFAAILAIVAWFWALQPANAAEAYGEQSLIRQLASIALAGKALGPGWRTSNYDCEVVPSEWHLEVAMGAQATVERCAANASAALGEELTAWGPRYLLNWWDTHGGDGSATSSPPCGGAVFCRLHLGPAFAKYRHVVAYWGAKAPGGYGANCAFFQGDVYGDVDIVDTGPLASTQALITAVCLKAFAEVHWVNLTTLATTTPRPSVTTSMHIASVAQAAGTNATAEAAVTVTGYVALWAVVTVTPSQRASFFWEATCYQPSGGSVM